MKFQLGIVLALFFACGALAEDAAQIETQHHYFIVAFKTPVTVSASPPLIRFQDNPQAIELIEQFALEVTPLFEDISSHSKDSHIAPAENPLPNLSRWMVVTVPSDHDPDEMLTLLKNLPTVEIAYANPTPLPAGFISSKKTRRTAPALISDQGYLNAAPAGNDVHFAWNQRGGRGKGITIADIEGDWNKRHLDLPLRDERIHGARAGRSTRWFDHGTAVAGILSARKDNYGITGIAHRVELQLYSVFRRSKNNDVFNSVSSAIISAARALKPGDIILIEVQYLLIENGALVPVEYFQDAFEAIQWATAKGITVVEAAGNSSQNLDDPFYENRFNRSIRGDSGAILVGAGGTPNSYDDIHFEESIDRQRLSFSNYGSRLDVQNWGELIVTTGYGDLYDGFGTREEYTAWFDGTSGAAAITAGVCASLQGIAVKRIGRPLTPSELRTVLVESGTPQLGDTRNFPIGPRPDLKAAVMLLDQMFDRGKND